MKRLFFSVMFIFLAYISFAKGQKEYFELGVAFPYFNERSSISGINVTSEISSFAINFAGVSFQTDTMGIGAYGNLIMPQKLTMSSMGQSISINSSAYDFLLGLDMLIGPVFLAYQKDYFSLPIAAGVHYMQLWSTIDGLYLDGISLGLGINATGQYRLNSSIYLLARLQLTLDLFSWVTAEQYYGLYSIKQTESSSVISWGISPTIGLGVQF